MKTSIKTKLRVGKIGYHNVLPFFYNLFQADEPGLQCIEAYPTKLNAGMRQGKIDIAPISSLEYLNHQKEYVLLPDVAIGARDFSGSVLLLSKEKIEGLNHEKIAVTHQSLSSVALLRILLKFKYKFENTFETSKAGHEEIIRKFKASLLIGDDALLFHSREFYYKYDLSELWWDWTSKPFCFALWAVRKTFAQKHPEIVTSFYHRLKANLNKNLSDIESLIRDALQMSFLDTDFPKVFGYLFNLSYGLDATMLEGLELFYRFANRLQISPRYKKIEFFDVKGRSS